jgi:peptide deformylase
MSETLKVKPEPAPLILWERALCGKQCDTVTKFDDDLKALVGRMIYTMRAYNGVGLAAPQIGIFKRVAVLHDVDDETHQKMFAIVNPKILERRGQQLGPDGCLSIPGKRVQPMTMRSEWIRFEYQDLDGERVEMECQDMQARVVQHEEDHLRGVFFIDHLSRIKRDLVLKSYASYCRRNKL